jgi:acyl-CoA dehydrogenase
VRITTIYEGTTGIQALDLVGRKLAQDMGATATRIVTQMQKVAKELEASDNEDVKSLAAPFAKAVGSLAETSQWIGMNAMGDLRKAVACSVPYLKLWGIVAGAWQMARAALISAAKVAAGDPESEFYKAKIATAKFYSSNVLSQSAWLKLQVTQGSGDVMTLPEAAFDLDRESAVMA